MMTPERFLSTACPQTLAAAMENQTNLQQLETAQTLSAYLSVWVLVEQELNTLRLNGRFDEADAGQAEFDRICAEVGPRLRQQHYEAFKPVTLNDVTSSALTFWWVFLEWRQNERTQQRTPSGLCRLHPAWSPRRSQHRP